MVDEAHPGVQMTVTAQRATTTAVIADDLTGANDTAVQFAREGWDARLLVTGAAAAAGSSPATTVLASTTEARSLGDAQAGRATAAAFGRAAAAGAERFYLKIDSTARGSIAGQIHGALHALDTTARGRSESPAMALVCPAYPGMGRTLKDAVLRVDGVPVAETALRQDPVTPVTVSDLREILPGAVTVETEGRDPAALGRALTAAREQGRRIVIVDAVSDDDLTTVSEAIIASAHTSSAHTSSAHTTLPVGSAGLARALAHLWPHTTVENGLRDLGSVGGTRLLIQVTSLNPASLRQVDTLSRRPGVTVLDADAQALSTPQSARQWAVGQAARLTDDDGVVVLRPPRERALDSGNSDSDTSDSDTSDSDTSDSDTSDSDTSDSDSRTMAARVGDAAAALLGSTEPGFAAAGFVGGDGASATLRAVGCTSLRVVDSLDEGMPLAVTADGELPGLPLFTKAGGFGTDASIIHAVDAIRDLLNRSSP